MAEDLQSAFIGQAPSNARAADKPSGLDPLGASSAGNGGAVERYTGLEQTFGIVCSESPNSCSRGLHGR